MCLNEHALEAEEANKLGGSLDSSQWETEIKCVHKTTDQFLGISLPHFFRRLHTTDNIVQRRHPITNDLSDIGP